MARNKVIKLWTAVITAFIALCTTLGLVTTASAATPVQQPESPRNSTASVTFPTTAHWAWAYARTLPPTMKQRIHAEAHGSSPSCRHRAPADPAETSAEEETHTDSAAPCADRTQVDRQALPT
ncbi:DUF6344 domain-containing protein [Streptomyces sp. 2A115]|uniref:DUF6344 domain-containing protein n=1 Tax=Streptomyces sp. 2A115 TaxID=3457439 RepID=UPI003FD14BBD